MNHLRILAIESSCDETAVAIVSRNDLGQPAILAQNILSQIDEHQEFGGVVPEIAARAHLSNLDHLIRKTLNDANMDLCEMDAIAATAGPGLIGGLMVGVMTAKALALTARKPFLAVNHLEGHALTVRLTHDIPYPYLLLLVSGGHTQILEVNELGDYRRLATTIDDALGEAFDKTAKLLSLPNPGGPNVEKAALNGNPKRFDLPMPLRGNKTLNMSFSGLKTAVRQLAQQMQPLSKTDIADICASFQETVAAVLSNRCGRAMEEFAIRSQLSGAKPTLVVAGGVAANTVIRAKLEVLCKDYEWQFVAPPQKLCGDNAAMIGWAALERFESGESGSFEETARSRWPLDENSTSVLGSGRRGVKV